MPQQDKAAPDASSGRSELEGKALTPTNEKDRVEAVRLAFDYRGDVTVILKDGSSHKGFVYNYLPDEDKVSLFIAEGRQSAPAEVTLSEIETIDFSGDDKAFGKSWDNWMAKSKAQREAEAERIQEEQKELGIL
ncbi:MAG: hypothetical protein AAF984_08170 [Verrucomicrobiota bacterium]